MLSCAALLELLLQRGEPRRRKVVTMFVPPFTVAMFLRSKKPFVPPSLPKREGLSPARLTRQSHEGNRRCTCRRIPVILMNTEDKTSGRDAYVGGDLVAIGHRYAQYLVDHNFVKKGDF